MRHVIVTALIAATLLGTGDLGHQATAESNPANLYYAGSQEKANPGPCADYDWNGGAAEMRRAIRCVWARFEPGEGGAPKAISVAECESGLDPDAYGNGNAGLFQHRVRYWPGRFERFITDNDLRSTWGLSLSVYSGRTNAIVTALMVRRSGSWSAWACG